MLLSRGSTRISICVCLLKTQLAHTLGIIHLNVEDYETIPMFKKQGSKVYNSNDTDTITAPIEHTFVCQSNF